MAALCEDPQAMSRTRLDFRASTSRGVSQFLSGDGEWISQGSVYDKALPVYTVNVPCALIRYQSYKYVQNKNKLNLQKTADA